MKFELTLIGSTVTPAPESDPTPHRKTLRESTDRVIHDALLANDLPGLVESSCDAMLAVARILATYAQDPQVPDFVEAAQALIETSRAVMDRGLVLHKGNGGDTMRCGAVMLELTVRGLCAALSVPYDDALRECHRAAQDGGAPQIRPLLQRAGIIAPDSPVDLAANDAG